MSAHLEGQIGSIVAGAGIVWMAWVAIPQLSSPSGIALPAGPIETCAVGILIWLHAKWRGSMKRV